ncbi:MFS transporter [Streptosporangium sp. NPDC002607]
MLTTTFPHGRDRARAFGVYGAVAGSGGGVGLILGGFLTEYLTWRCCLYVNVLFAAAALLLPPRLEGRLARSPPRSAPRVRSQVRPGRRGVSAGRCGSGPRRRAGSR